MYIVKACKRSKLTVKRALMSAIMFHVSFNLIPPKFKYTTCEGFCNRTQPLHIDSICIYINLCYEVKKSVHLYKNTCPKCQNEMWV